MKIPTSPKVPWSQRGVKYTDEEIDFIVEAMREADPLTQGRYQTRFQEAFQAYTGTDHAFAVSSCTAALHLAAVLSRIGPGDEVIIPGHTFAASAIPFGHTGASLVWADIDPDTLVVSPASLKCLITPRTKVIVVVHLYGLVCDMDPIMEMAAAKGILVVEDAAQALGATYKGRQAGSIGDFGCYSFHTHKNITTLGEGGMLTVKDEALAKVVPGFRHNGMRPFTGEREKYWVPAIGNVDFDWDGAWPYNFSIGEIQCAAGLIQLKRVDTLNADRRGRAHRIMEALKGHPELAFQETPEECENVHYCLPARYDGDRDAFIERMAFHHGVFVAVQYCPLYRYPMFQRAGFGEADCPETDLFYDRMISFPFHHWMPDDQFDFMVKETRETAEYLRSANPDTL